mgnify:FL=1
MATITQDIEKGTKPTRRLAGLRDPAEPNGKGGDRFAPVYDLVINGKGITEQVRGHITSVEYEDNEELFDQIKITLTGFFDGPKTGRTISVCEWALSDETFSEGNIIWVMMGYRGQSNLVGAGEIVKREFDYSQNPTMTVICYEPLHRMAQVFADDAKSFPKMRSSDIVKKIAQKDEYGKSRIGALFNTDYIDRLPIFTTKAEVQKRGESDYAFIKRMADVRGWHLYTRFDLKKKKFNLYYGPDVDKQETIFRYEYNPPQEEYPEDTILSFKPTITTIDQNTEVQLISVNEKKKKKVEQGRKYIPYADGAKPISRTLSGSNNSFKETQLQNPVAYRFQIFGVSKRILAKRPFKDEKEVKNFIINWARLTIKNFITGSLEVAGNEYIQSRQNIFLMGLGITFSDSEGHPAKWYVTKVTHKMEVSGSLIYSSNAEVRKVIDWLPEGDLVANPAAIKTEKDKAAKFKRVTGIYNSVKPK